MALWCWGEGGIYDEIKLVQFFMKVNAYNLKYSPELIVRKMGVQKAHTEIVIFITQNN